MSYTTITVRKEVYDELKAAKNGESFSDFLSRLLERKGKDFLKFAGSLGGMSKEEFIALKEDMATVRRNFRVRQ
jgi:predicted CopG family antitoxin